MNKTAIKNFAIWARQKLIGDIAYKAGLLGVSIKGIAEPLPQSTKDLQLLDIGTNDYAKVVGEQIRQRNALVEAIKGKLNDLDYASAFENVVEEVAYTWFNRLIAIRFMEVNDYLPGRVRVLSSENPLKHEPDLVTNPFDSDLVFSALEQDLVISLKDENKLDELFRLLFVKQCNKLYDILPELFEPTNDYTELLLTLSFTDKDDVVYHLTHDIDERDFNISEIDDNGKPTGQVEIIGWLYQYYNTEPKAKVSADLKKNIKVSKENIPAVTQLFTPDWIVRYMVENSLGRLWTDGHPADCKLKENWKYYLEEAEQEPQVQEQLAEIKREQGKLNLEEIRFIDPCMGSGHILVYAFDVFMQIYEAQGFTQRDAAQRIVEHNLYGLEIDKRAYQLAYFAVMMKARQYDRRFFSRGIAPQLYCPTGYPDGAEFGSLLLVNDLEDKPQENVDRHLFSGNFAEELNRWNFRCLLAQKYDVVCTNPPYMRASNMNARLSEFVKKNYPDEKSDLFSCFMKRADTLVKSYGFTSLITMESWMFLSSFEKLRKIVNQTKTIINMVHMPYLGKGGTSLGINFGTAAVIMKKGRIKNYLAQYEYTVYYECDENGIPFVFPTKNERWKTATQDNFSKIPGSPVAYWVSEKFINAFENKKISDIAKPCKGIDTGNNDIFLRIWFEVNKCKCYFNTFKIVKNTDFMIFKWFPYNKGGAYRRWYGNNEYLIDWTNNGDKLQNYSGSNLRNKSFYFLDGLTWSTITSAQLSVRRFGYGYLFDNGGTCLFSDYNNKEFILALLNSNVVKHFLSISPTLNFQPGDIAKIPVIIEEKNTIEQFVEKNIELSKTDWDSYEISWDFKKHPLLVYGYQNDYGLVDGDCIEETPPLWYDFEKHIFEITKGEAKHPNKCLISDCYAIWYKVCEERFQQLKANEEELNRIFIDIYGLEDELTPDVADKDVTVHIIFDSKEDVPEELKGSNYVRTKRDEVVSLLSYAVGCMFGRYSIYTEGLFYAGGFWDYGSQVDRLCNLAKIAGYERYQPMSIFLPDRDNCIPITDEEYFNNDIVKVLANWLKKVYGEDTLEENLDFIASALGNKGNSSREIIRNYFLSDFFKDHIKTYQKRPIYWLFDSGKQNGFKALVYMHRWNADMIGNVRVDYLHRIHRVYESEIKRMQEIMDASDNAREVAAAEKRKTKLNKQLKECQEYDAKIAHLALARIDIDLDDGVKVNYEKVQTTVDGKKLEILAKIK